MRKGIYLRVELPGDRASQGALSQDLQSAFTALYPAMSLQVKDLSQGDKQGIWKVLAYIEGNQKATDDFAAAARKALGSAINSMQAQKVAALGVAATTKAVAGKKIKPPKKIKAADIEEVGHEDEDSDVIYPPERAMPPSAIAAGAPLAAAAKGGIPTDGDRPEPPPNVFHQCPAIGLKGDADLNLRKNRTDKSKKKWLPVAISDIVKLPAPKSVQGKKRSQWPASSAKTIRTYEGLAVQVEGWLTGAKAEGPEACNCGAVADNDYHLWLIDFPPQHPPADRAKSVVCEVTPRVRAKHTGWDIEHVGKQIDGVTKVRLSGWLLMDQDHADQIGKTRATLWEIHPIIVFEVFKGNQWVALDDA
jgi:hypothetical protein